MAGETLPPSYNQAMGGSKGDAYLYNPEPTQSQPVTQPTQSAQPQVVHQTVIVADPMQTGGMMYCNRCNQNVRKFRAA